MLSLIWNVRIGKAIETENKLEVLGAGGRGKWEVTAMEIELFFGGGGKNILEFDSVMDAQLNTLKTIELYTLKGWTS